MKTTKAKIKITLKREEKPPQMNLNKVSKNLSKKIVEGIIYNAGETH